MTLARRSLLSGLAAATVLPGVSNASQIKDLRKAVEKAIQGSGELRLEPGTYRAPGIEIDRPLRISGVPGQTRIVAEGGKPCFMINNARDVSLSGLTFTAENAPQAEDYALVVADQSEIAIDGCRFETSPGSGLRLERCSGRVTQCRFSDIAVTALFSRNAKGLEISGNDLRDIGNNGIQVWTSELAEDGTLVNGNRIQRVAAKAGGTGQNGNGINVYKSGNVLVSGNRISDCAFSAVRNNSGANCQIVNNSISRMGEVAIYCEFGFEGAMVAGNLIEDVALGISVTNFNEGGRLASVANNVIRKVKGGGTLPNTRGIGIGAEADTAVTGNVIEDARHVGISLGWGPYARNLSATGNLLRNCETGIAFSVSEGADQMLISNNRISGAIMGAIVGSDHGTPQTGDLGLPGAEITRGVITGNLVF